MKARRRWLDYDSSATASIAHHVTEWRARNQQQSVQASAAICLPVSVQPSQRH